MQLHTIFLEFLHCRELRGFGQCDVVDDAGAAGNLDLGAASVGKMPADGVTGVADTPAAQVIGRSSISAST